MTQMKDLTESQASALKTLAAYEVEWGMRPTASELAGYESKDGQSSPSLITTKAAAQTLSFLHKRGLVMRWKTKFGFIYSSAIL